MKKFFYISIVLLISLICLSSCNDAGGLFNGARNASKLSNDIILGILDVSTSNNDITFNSNLYGVQTVSGSTDTDYSEKETEDVYSRKVRGSNWFNDVALVSGTYYAKIYDCAGSSEHRSKITTFDNTTKMLVEPTSDTKYSCLTENGYALTTDNKCYLITNVGNEIKIYYEGNQINLTNLLSSTGSRISNTTGYFLGSYDGNCYAVFNIDNQNGIAFKCSYKEEDGTEVSIDAVCLSISNDGSNKVFILDSDGYIYSFKKEDQNAPFTNKNSTKTLLGFKDSTTNAEIPSTAKFTGMIASKDNTFWISTKKNGIYKVQIFDSVETPVTVTRVY